jgi:hypothetical protein
MKEGADEIAPIIKEIRSRFAAKNYALADHLLNRISESDIERATLIEKVRASAILVDKARVLDCGEIEQAEQGGVKVPFEIKEIGE